MGQRTRKRNRAKRRLGRLPPTDEFIRFGSLFHQDILYPNTGFEEATRRVIASFKGEERRRLRDFIGVALQSNLTPEEWSKLWGLACKDWGFHEAEAIPRFLTQVHHDLRKGL